MITPNQVRTYIDGDGHCPFCGDQHIVGGHIQAEGAGAWQAMTCHGCGRRWTDGYTLDRMCPDDSDEFVYASTTA